MDLLKQQILEQGQILPGGILKVDGIVNHQFIPKDMAKFGEELASRFQDVQIDRILTAEVSGIAIAYAVGVALGVPVVFARKKQTLTMMGQIYL